ncbi:MAG: LysM peptidoglycan-binding domain-containing protein [Rhodopseudomonas palustris]|nr:LysM peptidoglycan-binding domain-containing protein [Rhodopseudomonas palustris]
MKNGDTVYDLAKKYQVNQQIIIETNELQNGAIKIGQVLVIPGGKMPKVATAQVLHLPAALFRPASASYTRSGKAQGSPSTSTQAPIPAMKASIGAYRPAQA